MTRPDTERLRRQAVEVIGGAGEVATWRKWVSAGSTAAAQYGVQAQNYYTETTVTGMFARFDPKLAQYQGGHIQVAALYVTLPIQMSPRDEIIWESSAYRLDGNADHETIGWGHVLWSHPLKLANITG